MPRPRLGEQPMTATERSAARRLREQARREEVAALRAEVERLKAELAARSVRSLKS